MRRWLAVFAFSLPTLVLAQLGPPPKLEPIVEPPPPPVGVVEDAAGPGVTLKPGEQQTEEYTDSFGQKYVRVRQPNGWTYYLIEARPGDAPFAGANSSDNRVRVPQYLLYEW
jgi:hypothetical protein